MKIKNMVSFDTYFKLIRLKQKLEGFSPSQTQEKPSINKGIGK